MKQRNTKAGKHDNSDTRNGERKVRATIVQCMRVQISCKFHVKERTLTFADSANTY